MKKPTGLLIGLSFACVAIAHNDHETASFTVEQYAGGKTPWTHLEANNDPDHFQFVVVGDRTGGMRPGVFAEAVEKINLMQPEFVVSIGDLVTGRHKSIDAEWNEFNGIVQRLEMPFFYVSGNHDFKARIDKIWTERFGPSYYSFKYNDVLFITLNTMFIINGENLWPGEHERQLAFLKETIAKETDVRWTILLVHHPLWNYVKTAETPKSFRPIHERWLEIEQVLKDRKYTLFAGHRHQYNKEVRNGQKYITLATTGGGSKLRGVEYGEFDHFLWVTMTDDGPVIANLLLDGVLDIEQTPTLPPKP